LTKVRCLHAWQAISGVRCGCTEGAAKVKISDFRWPRVKSSNRRLDADHRRPKWAARIVRARAHTVTFANADPKENHDAEGLFGRQLD
jgi:hypothetical protein